MKTVRESYVKRLRDNYLLILRTLMHDLIVSIDKDGNFVFVNDAAVEFFGKPRKKLIGAHFSGYIHPDDLKKTIAALHELAEQKGQVTGFILRAKGPSGFRPIAWNGIAIFDEMGNYIGAQATGKDISELLRVEEELKQSKQHFQSLFDVIVDPIVIVDLTGTILELSQSAEEIFGFSKDELVGKRFLETKLAKADTKEVMTNNLKRLKQGMYISPYSIEATSKDGKPLFYQVSPTRIVYKGEAAILAIFRNITEQKKAEEKLRASEERFKYFLDNAPEAIWIQDSVGAFLDGNKRAEELTGYKKEELLGKNMLDIGLVPPETIPRLMEEFSANTPGEISGPIELELVKKDGTKVFVEATTIPVDRNGKIELIGITRDITDRKKAEAALQESEKRFRELSELLPETIFETDLNGKLTFANDVAFKRFGYTQKDFEKGLTAFQMLIPEDRNNAKEEIAKALSGSDSGFLEYTALRKDGSTFPVIIHATPIIRKNMPVGLRGILVDITERKKSEEALKKSEERFRSTLDGMLEGCQIIDYDWRYLYVNDAAAEHGRIPKEDLIGKTMMELYPGIEKTELFSVLKKSMEEHLHTHLENNFVYPDGKTAWFELSVEPVPEGIFILSIDVSDRKEVQEALRQEREMLETVTANINAGLVLVSKDYRILWANEVIKDYVGEVEGKECFSSLNQEKGVCTGCGVKEIFDTGKDWVVHEQKIATPQGDDVWLEVTATAIRDANGEIVAASEMSWDITERKKTEFKLKESLQKFQTIFEGATDGIIALNPETQKFAFVNPRMTEITGYPLKEFLQLNMLDLLRKQDIPLAMDKYDKMVAGETSVTQAIPILRKDKSLVYCAVNSRLMKIGDVNYLVAFLRDVTEQKKAEEALRASEEKYRELINAMNDTALVMNFDWRFIDANDAAVKVLGYSKEELRSMGPRDITHAVTDEEIKSALERLQREKKEILETEFVTKDGKIIPMEISLSLVTYQGKEAILNIARDITERKKAEDAIKEANLLLKQSNTELESYTYVVSHDLKAPLRTIKSFSSFLLEDFGNKLDETGQDYLNRMVNASSRMGAMIEDLLTLSRVGRKFTEFERINLNKLVSEILEDLEATIKETKTNVVVDKLPTMVAQRVWMRQLFMNLISNALKFNESKTPEIKILYTEKEGEHLFKVQDNGIGIEEKYLTRIFNLFERAPTEKKYEGTGAGLAICKKIVDHLGGKIWVESTPNKGSTFFFTIPKESKQK